MDTMSKLPKITFKRVKKYQGGIKTWTSVWNVYANDVLQKFTVELTDNGYIAGKAYDLPYDTKIQAVRAYLSMQGVKFR